MKKNMKTFYNVCERLVLLIYKDSWDVVTTTAARLGCSGSNLSPAILQLCDLGQVA